LVFSLLVASASAGPLRAPGFKVSASNGYTLYVSTLPAWQRVELILFKKRNGRFTEGEGAIYGVQAEVPKHGIRAEVGRGAIRAELGRLGSINVRFHPTGGAREYRPYCGGKAIRFPRGFYEGTIRFRGEHDYTCLDASRAQDVPAIRLRSRCPGHEIGVGPPTLPGAYLVANSVRTGTPELQAFKETPETRAFFSAGINESSYGLSISRFVAIFASPAAFEYGTNLETATVRPPAPFSGTGIFRADRPKNRRWSGDLAVDLPGRRRVRLTGKPLLAFINPAQWIKVALVAHAARPRPRYREDR
jgi:hypothetical protein